MELNSSGKKKHALSLEMLWFAGIDERKTSRKCLIKVRSFPGRTCSDMCHYLVPILEKSRPCDIACCNK